MSIDFVLDDSGNPQKDANTGFFLVKRDGVAEPLDLNRLFAGINASNSDAAEKRRKLEAANAELEKLKAENADLRTVKEEKTLPAKESETERRIKALEDSLAKEREEKKRIQEDQDRREADRQIEAAFFDSAYVAEHGHIPADMWAARYRSHCALEEINGVKALVVKDLNGNIVMSEKNPGLPAKLDEALPLLCAARSKPGDIKLNPAPFGGAGTPQTQRFGIGANPWAKGQENVTQQHKIMAEDPALAARLQAQAGKTAAA